MLAAEGHVLRAGGGHHHGRRRHQRVDVAAGVAGGHHDDAPRQLRGVDDAPDFRRAQVLKAEVLEGHAELVLRRTVRRHVQKEQVFGIHLGADAAQHRAQIVAVGERQRVQRVAAVHQQGRAALAAQPTAEQRLRVTHFVGEDILGRERREADEVGVHHARARGQDAPKRRPHQFFLLHVGSFDVEGRRPGGGIRPEQPVVRQEMARRPQHGAASEGRAKALRAVDFEVQVDGAHRRDGEVEDDGGGGEVAGRGRWRGKRKRRLRRQPGGQRRRRHACGFHHQHRGEQRRQAVQARVPHCQQEQPRGRREQPGHRRVEAPDVECQRVVVLACQGIVHRRGDSERKCDGERQRARIAAEPRPLRSGRSGGRGERNRDAQPQPEQEIVGGGGPESFASQLEGRAPRADGTQSRLDRIGRRERRVCAV